MEDTEILEQIQQHMRIALESYIGQKTSPDTLEQIKYRVIQALPRDVQPNVEVSVTLQENGVANINVSYKLPVVEYISLPITTGPTTSERASIKSPRTSKRRRRRRRRGII